LERRIHYKGGVTRAALRWTVAALTLGWASLAAADAQVAVELRDADGKPADGEVRLEDAAGKAVASCKTQGGRCEMSAVPGGNYKAEVTPDSGTPPKPKSVMIPPSGKVSLIMSTGGG
jgi:hypothetical protein